jgi:hypothetical protein
VSRAEENKKKKAGEIREMKVGEQGIADKEE